MLQIGKMMVIAGLGLAAIGAVLWLLARLFPGLGNLPGDLHWESEHVKVYAPLTTMLLVSLLASVLLSVIVWLLRR